MDAIDGSNDQGLAAISVMMHGPQPKVADDPEAALLALTEESNTGTGPELDGAVAKACATLIKAHQNSPPPPN